ncbi:hypothetical protein ATN89_17460 [Comamonas thiooxydans]|uniref:hypothetical protein n=1 Tax=Comamonas thiooxydans TaxID=363952 RepID=UPI0007C4B522|nr:hypothetical protein [Comamonas thiooxydans]OAD82870.1 hypothetical protein ATN89_17460 [Comamonas thiooxydans]
MLAQVMATYGHSYQNTMAMPMRAFWKLAGFTQRISAARSFLDLQVFSASQSSESAKTLAERLQEQAPEPVKRSTKAVIMANSQRDHDASARLRAMMI